MTTNTVEVEIPFSGFYESWHDATIDRAIESMLADPDGNGEDPTPGLPDDAYLRINYRAIQREYVIAYAELFGIEYGLTVNAAVDMQSPREYNFSTDRIFTRVKRSEFDALRAKVELDAEWPEYVRQHCTSYDGFWSFYSNDVLDSVWTRPHLDVAQTRLVLEFYAGSVGGHDWELRLIEYVRAEELQSLQTECGKILDSIDCEPQPVTQTECLPLEFTTTKES